MVVLLLLVLLDLSLTYVKNCLSAASCFVGLKKRFIPKTSISLKDEYEVFNHTKSET